jgi:hypothetical protein
VLQGDLPAVVQEAMPNFQPDHNVCPSDPADIAVPNDDKPELANRRIERTTAKSGSGERAHITRWDRMSDAKSAMSGRQTRNVGRRPVILIPS